MFFIAICFAMTHNREVHISVRGRLRWPTHGIHEMLVQVDLRVCIVVPVVRGWLCKARERQYAQFVGIFVCKESADAHEGCAV